MSISSSFAGSFVFLKKQSLLGDVLAHSVFPGVCISFLISGYKDNLLLLVGASITGVIAMYLIQYLSNQKKVKQDASLALVLSSFFSLGIIILVFMQNSGVTGQSGIETFLFGSAASILISDYYFFGPACFIILLLGLAFLKEIKSVSFDPGFALTSGIKIKLINSIISFLALLAIISGIQAMGVVLMAALIIIPPTIGRTWSNQLKGMILIAIISAMISSLFGTFFSSSYSGSPTGPWIVIFLGMLATISFVISPTRGLISQRSNSLRKKIKIQSEHILKALYKDQQAAFSGNILDRRAIKTLTKKGLIKTGDKGWKLSPSGIEEAKRLIRLHRLWELYLTKKMGIASDHVHEDADSVEHIISVDIEELLLEDLDRPIKDPHNQEIPYPKSDV